MLKLIVSIHPYARYLLVAWLLAILIVSSIPSLPTIKIHTSKSEIRLDYLIHFLEYGILAFMAYLSFADDRFKISMKKYILITILLIFFALIDEYHQKFIPGRAFNTKDIRSNIAGISAALVLCVLVFRSIAGKIH